MRGGELLTLHSLQPPELQAGITEMGRERINEDFSRLISLHCKLYNEIVM